MSAVLNSAVPERRQAKRVHLGNVIARVNVGDGSEPVMVCVWDLSTKGACVLVPPDVALPDRFKLVFDHDTREASVVWRTWSHVGISFVEEL